MDLQLKDDVVLVAGAADGIGRAIAAAFVAEGAKVALLDRSPQVHKAADELAEGKQGRTCAAQLDVTDYAAVQAAVKKVTESWGLCHHLVYAVGLESGKSGFPFWNLEPSDWPRILNVNLVGAVNVAHAVAPAMAAAGRGSLLFLSSIAGQIGSQTDPPYSAAKAGLINFAQCAAKDLGPYGVRVNTICPGMVKTRMNEAVWAAVQAQLPEKDRTDYDTWAAAKIAKLVPLNRWQTPQDVAVMAVFLASPCSCNVTGQTVNVDGGIVMHS